VIIPKAIMLTAALGTALLLGSATASSLASLPSQPGSALPSLAVGENESTAARCGARASTDSIALQPLPNAYMIVNGRVFSLTDVFTCARRLHTARLSSAKGG